MPYLSFLDCIDDLYSTYIQSRQQMTVSKFYSNKVDPIKFLFDTNFNGISIKNYIDLEIIRQNDKTINNAIGYFHQNLIGGINGFLNMGTGGGCDIKKSDNTIFAEIKNKHNTMNSSSIEATYHKLERFAKSYPKSCCYLVEIISKKSKDIQWSCSINKIKYSQPNIRRITADKFYEIATGNKNAFYELCKSLPQATQDYLNLLQNPSIIVQQNKILNSLSSKASSNSVDILTQIMNDTFEGYNGF